MEKDKLPKTHVEQIGEIKAANENPSIQEERVKAPMDSASTTTISGDSIPEKEIEEKIDQGKESKNKSFAEKEIERKASNSKDKGATRGGKGGGGGFKIPGQFFNGPDKLDEMLNFDPFDDNKPLSINQYQGDENDKSPQFENDNIQLALNDLSSQPSIDDNTTSFDEVSKEDFKAALNDVYSSIQEKEEIDQSGQTPQNPTENDNVQLALNDFSSQPSIEDNTSSFDEISKEDFKGALNDVNYSLQEKEEVAETSNDLSQEDFSNTLTDLNFDERKNKDIVGIPDRDSEDGKEDTLETKNDFDTSSDREEIGSFYWESEVYESKLELGEIDEDGTPDMGGMDGDDD